MTLLTKLNDTRNTSFNVETIGVDYACTSVPEVTFNIDFNIVSTPEASTSKKNASSETSKDKSSPTTSESKKVVE